MNASADKRPRCPVCGMPGGVLLFSSVAPCDRCFTPKVIAPPPADAWGANWPPPIGTQVERGPKWDRRWDHYDKFGTVRGTVLAAAVHSDIFVIVRWPTGIDAFMSRENIAPVKP